MLSDARVAVALIGRNLGRGRAGLESLPVEIVDEHTHRVLAYVDALNRHGVKPDEGLVNGFADAPDLKESMSGLASLAAMASMREMFAPRRIAY